jgi:hypothetical protein
MTAKCVYFLPSGERPAWWVTPATNSMLSHVAPLASATATRAVTGEHEPCMGSRKCNYSGNCPNRTKGVRDVHAAEAVSDAAGQDDVCPLSMEKSDTSPRAGYNSRKAAASSH